MALATSNSYYRRLAPIRLTSLYYGLSDCAIRERALPLVGVYFGAFPSDGKAGPRS